VLFSSPPPPPPTPVPLFHVSTPIIVLLESLARQAIPFLFHPKVVVPPSTDRLPRRISVKFQSFQHTALPPSSLPITPALFPVLSVQISFFPLLFFTAHFFSTPRFGTSFASQQSFLFFFPSRRSIFFLGAVLNHLDTFPAAGGAFIYPIIFLTVPSSSHWRVFPPGK